MSYKRLDFIQIDLQVLLFFRQGRVFVLDLYQ